MKQEIKRVITFIFLTLLISSCNQAGKAITPNDITLLPESDVIESDLSSQIGDDVADNIVDLNDISGEIIKYFIIDAEFVENKVSIKYPQITCLHDIIKQDSINEILKNEAMIAFNYYDNISVDLNLDIDYEITWMSNNLLSIKYSGSGYGGSAAYPTSLLYTVNIDINNCKKIVLSDYINVDQDFVKKFMYYRESEESMTNYALEYLLLKSSVDNFIDDFCKADLAYENSRAVFSYFTEDSLGISIKVSHLFGGHIEIELKYVDLKDNVIVDSDVWNDFSDYTQ